MLTQPRLSKKWVWIPLLLTSLSLPAWAQPVRELYVSADSEVEVRPDQLQMRAEIFAEGADLAATREQVEERMRTLLQALQNLGIDANKMQAGSIQVVPKMHWQDKQPPKRIGSRVSRELRLHLEDLSLYPQVLEALFAAKVDHLGQVSFSYSKAEQLEQQALTQALQKAQAKAQLMAQALNVRLGEVMTVRESRAPQMQPVMYRMAAPMADMEAAGGRHKALPQYEAGEIKVSAAVDLVFRLQEVKTSE
ncbi:hypothetical protein SAMN05421831_108111 [Allopseudospirillum japonicum]|uniref:DUF541 domain-containing protein n=1 Tax=Allopseudospirillum japonicum TaxID=64971 RepID=A0A1H6SZ89_9GAMM|nr:SIMPL domain-containing protein [Allopseudospirillum japonicum]SEI72276.1 hypothetical protein SAMN05421831_108111 [Allopseudospirillum japonicum]